MAVGVRVYVATFLLNEDRVLLLRRGEDRRFAPGLWTGVGGKVEVRELDDLEGAALREVCEETGLDAEVVRDLRVRVVLTQPEGLSISVLVFCTAWTDCVAVGPCDEGCLHWVEAGRATELSMIENAARALPLALGPGGGVRFGVCASGPDGRLLEMVMASERVGF